MKNIKIYNEDCFEFHKKNYEKNKEKLIKNGLEAPVIKQNNIKLAFQKYERLFHTNSLEYVTKDDSLVPTGKKDTYCNILYSYKSINSNLFYQFKQNLKTTDGDSILVCPFCEHDTSATLDHIIAKKGENGYPEFCDMPYNLIPMCFACNKHKGSTWVENNKIKYINLYKDKIPAERFLFLDITITNNKAIELKFFIDLTNIQSQALGRKLKTTFEDLHILEMYNQVGKQEVQETQKIILKYKQIKTQQDIKDAILFETDNDNNYRNIIKRTCVENTTIFDYLYEGNKVCQ